LSNNGKIVNKMNSAILITYDKEDAVTEAIGLCDAAGIQVIHTIKQHFLKKPKYGISGGVLEKLEEIAEKLKPDVIVFDEILKPSQNYNLASVLHREVLDREALILEIFESRASSAESKLQVKLAQLRYELVRAKEKVRLSSMGEQPGFMGIGKFEIDVYHDDIKHRMQSVKSKLEKAGKQRELHRRGRKRLGFKTISLAGYTSSGKTTLFNKITGESKEQSQSLFTTLSTTTRRFSIDREPFLIADTVGFISKLPAYMIDAFKSTLEELIHTDVIIVVVDISDSLFELRKKFASCMRTLSELGVEMDRIIFALNKSDLLTDNEIEEKIDILNLKDYKKRIAVSAKTGHNVNELKDLIKDIIQSQKSPELKKVTPKEFDNTYGN
jgi:GTP-binding protein HflX